MNSLWGEEFEIKEVDSKALIKKVNNPKEVSVEKAIKSKKLSTNEKLLLIRDNVYRILGKYKEDTVVIKTKQELVDYIDVAISNGEIAIDTETNKSLDPLTCILMGACIYTPSQKNAYVPINHTDKDTGKRLDWQLTEKDIKEQFDRLKDTKIIMHNGKFDYQVIKCTCNCVLDVYWDTMIGARLINENERAGLKEQYITKIDPSIEKYSIEHLFKDIEYEVVEPELFALYAATDSFMTYKLYQWQKKWFEKNENKKLFNLFMTVEMPVMIVAAEMELIGVCIDKEYSERLSKKYHDKSIEVEYKISKELEKYNDIISKWRLTPAAQYKPTTKAGKEGKSKSEQLKTPVEVTSPTQLAILLYDILNVPVVDKNTPRGTGEEILTKINLPLCKLILEKRNIDKLIGTYIDKLPDCVSEKDGRLHAHFNQLGTDTGRFSSTDPNLQNIPSHEKSIRLMFTASDGYVMVGSDFSQQEPRLLAFYAQDENMINAYRHGKDLYSTIASGVYHNNYEDNLEHNPDGTINPEGKKRRTSVKALLLGIMYGMGVPAIADNINCSIQEAQKIYDDFFKSYPKVKKWIDDSQDFARKYGYAEDIWGRRRRLPDIQLDKFEITNNNISNSFNPLLGSKNIINNDAKYNKLIESYKQLLESAKSKKEIDAIKDEALANNINIKNNGGFIARAERQCGNARIQGGAATMSKKAMILVHNDEELNALGFRLLIAVHDELIGECPIENADKVKDRLSYLMVNSAKPECDMPMKCDATEFKSWYLDEITADIKEKYNSGKSINDLQVEYSEFTVDQLNNLIKTI